MISNKFIFTYITCSQSIDTIGRYGVFNIYFCIASFLVYLKKNPFREGSLKKTVFYPQKGVRGKGSSKMDKQEGDN